MYRESFCLWLVGDAVPGIAGEELASYFSMGLKDTQEWVARFKLMLAAVEEEDEQPPAEDDQEKS